jgi:hypothetical protein
MTRTVRAANPTWINACIAVGAGFFIFALFLSAVFDPRIRVLHTLQALIYVAVIVLTRRRSAWGFGAGFFIAVLWNYTNLFITNFVRAGAQQFVVLVTTGHLHRPDLLVALVAAAGHFLMIAACLAGFLRLRPKGVAWAKFMAGGVVAIGYFVGIIYTTGPQYIGLVRRIFHI